MKTTILVGIVLIVLGLVAVVYGGITYTTQEEMVRMGPIEVTAQKKKTIPLPPVLGGVAIIGGIILVALGGQKS